MVLNKGNSGKVYGTHQIRQNIIIIKYCGTRIKEVAARYIRSFIFIQKDVVIRYVAQYSIFFCVGKVPHATYECA